MLIQIPFGHLGGRIGTSPEVELLQNSFAGIDLCSDALGLGVLVCFTFLSIHLT